MQGPSPVARLYEPCPILHFQRAPGSEEPRQTKGGLLSIEEEEVLLGFYKEFVQYCQEIGVADPVEWNNPSDVEKCGQAITRVLTKYIEDCGEPSGPSTEGSVKTFRSRDEVEEVAQGLFLSIIVMETPPEESEPVKVLEDLFNELVPPLTQAYELKVKRKVKKEDEDEEAEDQGDVTRSTSGSSSPPDKAGEYKHCLLCCSDENTPDIEKRTVYLGKELDRHMREDHTVERLWRNACKRSDMWVCPDCGWSRNNLEILQAHICAKHPVHDDLKLPARLWRDAVESMRGSEDATKRSIGEAVDLESQLQANSALYKRRRSDEDEGGWGNSPLRSMREEMDRAILGNRVRGEFAREERAAANLRSRIWGDDEPLDPRLIQDLLQRHNGRRGV